MTASTFIDVEAMRNRTVSAWTPTGRVNQPAYDLRGTPVGDRAEVWEWDRMVYPGRTQTGRRVREYVTVMHCPEGWHSTSGTAGEPATPICSTLLEARWAGPGFPGTFNTYHDEHLVLWVIKVKRHTTVSNYRYCDPELPGEYRPDPAGRPCADCGRPIAGSYVFLSARICGPCAVERYGDRAGEYLDRGAGEPDARLRTGRQVSGAAADLGALW